MRIQKAPLAGATLLAAWHLSACPRLASACAYCAAATGKVSTAYLGTAIGLGLLPLALGGGLFFWLRARYRRAAPRAEEERNSADEAA
jgi:hypothetical protein